MTKADLIQNLKYLAYQMNLAYQKRFELPEKDYCTLPRTKLLELFDPYAKIEKFALSMVEKIEKEN